MRPAELPQRLGLEGRPFDSRLAWRLVWAALVVYAVSFAGFYPAVETNDDGMMYIRQTRLLLQGTAVATTIDPVSGEPVRAPPSTYPPGTAVLMAPPVWLAGWRGAFVVPALSLIAGVVLCAHWLREAGRSPIFALLVLGFPPALVMGRVAMSDAPSLAVVALGLWLFWRGMDRGPGWWVAAGLVAGGSLLFRESNALPFVPLFAGAALRRDRNVWALVVGGACGVALRLVANYLSFGDPFYVRTTYVFSPETLGDRLPLYLLGLFVLVPGGGLFALAYRGPRRPELVAASTLFFLFYALQEYSTLSSTGTKRLVLALRYFLPLLPLLAFTASEAAPRFFAGALRRSGMRRALRTAAGAALAVWIAAVVAGAAGVHPAFQRWSQTQVRIRDEIARVVGNDSVVVTNWSATNKFIPLLDRRLRPIERKDVRGADLAALAARYDAVFIVLLDRTDSALWRAETEANQAFIEALAQSTALELDLHATATDRLRIWRVLPGTPSSPAR